MGSPASPADTDAGDGRACHANLTSNVANDDTKDGKEPKERRASGARRLRRIAALEGSDVALVDLLRGRCGDRKKWDECKKRELVEQHCLRRIKLMRLEFVVVNTG